MGCGASSAKDVVPVASEVDRSASHNPKETLLDTPKALTDVAFVKDAGIPAIRSHSQLVAEVSAQLQKQLSSQVLQTSQRVSTPPAASPGMPTPPSASPRAPSPTAEAPTRSDFQDAEPPVISRAASESQARSPPKPSELKQCSSWSAAAAAAPGSDVSKDSDAVIAAGMQKFMAYSAGATVATEETPISDALATEDDESHMSIASLPSDSQHPPVPEAYLAVETSQSMAYGATLTTVMEESENMSPVATPIADRAPLFDSPEVEQSQGSGMGAPPAACDSSRPPSAAGSVTAARSRPPSAVPPAPPAAGARPPSAVPPAQPATGSRPASAVSQAPPAAGSRPPSAAPAQERSQSRPSSAAAPAPAPGSRPASAAALSSVSERSRPASAAAEKSQQAAPAAERSRPLSAASERLGEVEPNETEQVLAAAAAAAFEAVGASAAREEGGEEEYEARGAEDDGPMPEDSQRLAAATSSVNGDPDAPEME